MVKLGNVNRTTFSKSCIYCYYINRRCLFETNTALLQGHTCTDYSSHYMTNFNERNIILVEALHYYSADQYLCYDQQALLKRINRKAT